jgi:hypothetical protein
MFEKGTVLISKDNNTLVYFKHVNPNKPTRGVGLCLHSLHTSDIGLKVPDFALDKFLPYTGELTEHQKELIAEYVKA